MSFPDDVLGFSSVARDASGCPYNIKEWGFGQMRSHMYSKRRVAGWGDLTDTQRDDLYYKQEVQDLLEYDLDEAVSEISDCLVTAFSEVGIEVSGVELTPIRDNLYYDKDSSCRAICVDPELFIKAVTTEGPSAIEMGFGWSDCGLGMVVDFYNDEVVPKMLDATREALDDDPDDVYLVEEYVNLVLDANEDRFAQLATDYLNAAYGYEYYYELGDAGVFDPYIN